MEQLRAALRAQRSAGRGRIGEWLRTLGFVSEQQVTAALARQWSCPVLRTNSFSPGNSTLSAHRAPQIPVTLLESFVMIPVEYVETTATLHIAFGEGIDYSVLYAIEQMLGCRTESCMAVPSLVRQNLQSLSERRGESEVVIRPRGGWRRVFADCPQLLPPPGSLGNPPRSLWPSPLGALASPVPSSPGSAATFAPGRLLPAIFPPRLCSIFRCLKTSPGSADISYGGGGPGARSPGTASPPREDLRAWTTSARSLWTIPQ